MKGFLYVNRFHVPFFFFFLARLGSSAQSLTAPQIFCFWENSLKAQPENLAYTPWPPHFHYRRFAWKLPRPNPPQGRERIPPAELRDLPPLPVCMCTPVLAETIVGI